MQTSVLHVLVSVVRHSPVDEQAETETTKCPPKILATII
jgi:hypothetical protein